MRRIEKKMLKNLTSLLMICFGSSLAFFVINITMNLITKDPVTRSILGIGMFSLDMFFLVLFMNCIYAIRALHEDMDTVWKWLFFRIVLLFAALFAIELKYQGLFAEHERLFQVVADMVEILSLMCLVMAYTVLTRCFGRLLKEVGKEKEAAGFKKGATIYLSIGISAALFSAASEFVPGEGKTVILAGILNIAVFVTRLAVILLEIPVFIYIREAIGNIWRIRLERMQEGRRLR